MNAHTDGDVETLIRSTTGRVFTICPEADFAHIEAMTAAMRRFEGDSPSHQCSWNAGVDLYIETIMGATRQIELEIWQRRAKGGTVLAIVCLACMHQPSSTSWITTLKPYTSCPQVPV
jgi:hypothetical protein